MSTTPTERQRRTVLGFLEDLQDRIELKRVCCDALAVNLRSCETELKTLEDLLADWDANVSAKVGTLTEEED